MRRVRAVLGVLFDPYLTVAAIAAAVGWLGVVLDAEPGEGKAHEKAPGHEPGARCLVVVPR